MNLSPDNWNTITQRCREHGDFHCAVCLGVPLDPQRGRAGSLAEIMATAEAYRNQFGNAEPVWQEEQQ